MMDNAIAAAATITLLMLIMPNTHTIDSHSAIHAIEKKKNEVQCEQ